METMELNANCAKVTIAIKVRPNGLTKEEVAQVERAIVSRIMEATPRIPFLKADVSDWEHP